MNQTIEQEREHEAYSYVGDNMNSQHFTSSERELAFDAFKDGAEWEYNRTKWVKVEYGLPDKDGLYLIRYKPGGDERFMLFSVDFGAFLKPGNDNRTVCEWCEIPK